MYSWGVPSGSDGKESTYRRPKFSPWVGTIPWRKGWLFTPVFLSGESQDRGAWRATVHGVTKESDVTATKQQLNEYIYVYRNTPNMCMNIHVHMYAYIYMTTVIKIKLKSVCSLEEML